MKRRTSRPHSPVVLTGPRFRRRRRVSAREEILGKEALETPLPGRLLVLLSRLHRSERAAEPDKNPLG